ncbi:hypothetical protein [Paracoccus marcusii]|uniref:hypothetical protein n=1 Tax=Paracoccus marcusii TaxID=59779 RepID=UPI0024939B6C|nr:hypothetical protein [Paracoccus marcusii]
MTHPSTKSQLNGGASSETIRHLDLDDHLTRLADLLHLIAAAADGLPPPHGAAITRGTQIALDEVEVIQQTLAGE